MKNFIFGAYQFSIKNLIILLIDHLHAFKLAANCCCSATIHANVLSMHFVGSVIIQFFEMSSLVWTHSKAKCWKFDWSIDSFSMFLVGLIHLHKTADVKNNSKCMKIGKIWNESSEINRKNNQFHFKPNIIYIGV